MPRIRLLLGLALIGGSPVAAQAPRLTTRAAETRFVDSILARMTVAEKLGQLNQLSGAGNPTGPGGGERAQRMDQLRQGGIGSFFNIVGADTTRALQKIAVEQSRLHIPLVFGLDVIHGFRTIFPVPLGEAASWDPLLTERAAHVAAAEASASGIDWTFAPMVDIARDPRWGRIVEGAGEDPYLGAVLAAARVRGFQGTNLGARDAIAATAKHFAAYGAAEGGRDYNVAEVSERTLRDVYLPPFHAAACADAATFMASFNEIAGVPSHANHHLLTDILRNEWKYDGLVVSDWTGIWELINHGVAADSAQAGELALHAGVDVDMVSEIYSRALPRSVAAKRVNMAELDEAVRHMLRLKYRLGLFKDPYLRENAAREGTDILTAANRAAARESGRKSIVLLKNDRNTLPLQKTIANLAVIGALATDSTAVLGNWTALGRHEDAVPVLDGIRRAVSAETNVTYAVGASPTSTDTSGIAEAVRVARAADAVVLVVGETGEMSAEAESRSTLALPGAQQQLADALSATGKPVVVVLMNGRPLSIERLNETMPAILETWFLGVEHGNAVADVLFGDENPGGKMPVTNPRVVGQVPIYYNHKSTGRPPTAEKYTSKYWDIPYTPLFPFGFGLSYTSFNYGPPRLSASSIGANDSLRVEVDVTNTGQRAGDEVVQLYVRDDVGSVTRPVMELRRFRRVTLAPGQKTTIRFSLGVGDLAFHDIAMRRVAEPGTFRVFVGTNSAQTQSAPFRLTGTTSVAVPDRCN